jgi:hypothetical protein
LLVIADLTFILHPDYGNLDIGMTIHIAFHGDNNRNISSGKMISCSCKGSPRNLRRGAFWKKQKDPLL